MWGVYSLRSRSYMEIAVAWLSVEMATTIRMQHHVRSNGEILVRGRTSTDQETTKTSLGQSSIHCVQSC